MLADVDVAVVGAGFSGLAMAIRLRRAGIGDFVVLERAGEVGGTWQANTYPGCACDVPSHLYSYSFAPNPDWTRTYSGRDEIAGYLRRCADAFGVRPHLRLRHALEEAAWLEDERRWLVRTDRGTLRARVLIAAAGPLTEPRLPDLPGLERFAGRAFHSARWDHRHDLRGRRVAAIGTGASAIQFVPAVAPLVAELHVFQRTPPWVVPHTSRPVRPAEREAFRRLPWLQKAVRGGVYAGREALVLGFAKEPRLLRVLERTARRHVAAQVRDPVLRERVTPDYALGCKRLLPSNAWYPALGRPNVHLVTAGVREVRPWSVVDGDGVERPVDTLLFGTGFQVTEMPIGRQIRGAGGRELAEAWQGSPRAHLGTTVPGFPNLFLLLGPNTGLGHSSMVYMIESQVAYVLDALRTMAARGADACEVRPEAAAASSADVDRRMRRTVWSSGCSSWYLDATGRNATLWPDFTFRFRRRLRRFDAESYRLAGA